MTFNHFNRRLHLYLALSLLPWFLMYGLSSIPFSHGALFQELYDDGVPQWTVRFERDYDRPVPEDADLRSVGAAILKDVGLEGAFGVSRPNRRTLRIYLVSFREHTRLTYYVDQKLLKAEDKRFRWDHFFTTLHARGGFQQDSFLNDAWAVLVDLVCIGFLAWIASGIYMWWLLPQTRRWGSLALGGGAVAFLTFLLAL